MESPSFDGHGRDPDHAKPVWVYPLTILFVCAVLLVIFIIFRDELSTVMLGVLAAAIVASTLNPLVRYFPGPRGIAAAVLGLSLIAAVGALLLALSWPLANQIQKPFHDWQKTKETMDANLARWSDNLQLQTPLTVDLLLSNTWKFFAGGSGTIVISRGGDVLFSILIWLAFIFIGSIFMLADPDERLLRPAVMIVSTRYRGRVQDILHTLGPRLRRWVVGTLISMCIVFSASCIGYFSIGLKFALPLALLSGLAEIVPTVGPACAAGIALLFAATQEHSGPAVVGVLIIYAIVQSIEAYLILPMIMRGAVKIHPAVTLFSVVLWGKIFGVPGLMLAIPINVTIGSLLEHLYVRPREQREALQRAALLASQREAVDDFSER